MSSATRSTSEQQRAAQWLRRTLAGSPVPAREVGRLAAVEGISQRTLERARSMVGARASKPAGKWMLSLTPKTEVISEINTAKPTPPNQLRQTNSAKSEVNSAEINTAKAEINTAKAEVNTTKAEVNTAKAEVNTAKINSARPDVAEVKDGVAEGILRWLESVGMA